MMRLLQPHRPNFALYDVRELFRRPPYPGTNVTLKRLLNLYLVRFQRMRAHEKLLGYPLMLTLEATNVCNLSCPGCFTGAGDVSQTKAHFPMPLYERMMDELGDYLFQLELHNWGEPLLDKNIPDLIQVATEKGISTLISTNFSFPFNDGFNYFFNRKAGGAKTTEPTDAIPLETTASRTSGSGESS